MNRTVLKSIVSSDGVLHLDVPLGTGAANMEVQIIVEPATPAPMSQGEWRRFVMETAGSITDPAFRRWEQGGYEKRDLPEVDIEAAFEEGTLIDEAMDEAVREAVALHQQAGRPLVVWQDGNIMLVPPDAARVTPPPKT
jgi:hypothetical protein